MALAEIFVPVPRMLVRRGSPEPSCLYRIQLGDTQRLVVETEHGYFGCAMICPHRGARLEVTATVHASVPAIVCQAHAIAYSLISGECLENNGAEHEDPGNLSTFPVHRRGEMFVVSL